MKVEGLKLAPPVLQQPKHNPWFLEANGDWGYSIADEHALDDLEIVCHIGEDLLEDHARGRIETDRSLGFVTVMVPDPKDGSAWVLERMTFEELVLWMRQ